MGELEFGKNVDDIEAPVLLPEGWRTMRLLEEPKVEDNKAMKEDPGSAEAGHNWRLDLETVDEEPMWSGRRFFLRFPLPRPSDMESYTSQGQKIYDAKMSRIVGFVEAFGGHISGSKASLGKGAIGQCYVLQQLNRLTQEPENSIDIFNQGFKKAEIDPF